MSGDLTGEWTVLEWDVVDGGILGATVKCRDCPCGHGEGCDGTGRLHMPYGLPDGTVFDLHADADALMLLMDRAGHRRAFEAGEHDPGGPTWLTEPASQLTVRTFLATRAMAIIDRRAAARGRKTRAEVAAAVALWQIEGTRAMVRLNWDALNDSGSPAWTTFMGQRPEVAHLEKMMDR